MNKIKYLFTLCIFFISLKSYSIISQIDLSFKGFENKNILFAEEYGKKQIVLDTIRLDTAGHGIYSSKNRLNTGIYTIIFPNQKYFELLISDQQFISISTDSSDIFGKLIIEGSDESDLFMKYQRMAVEYEKLQTEIRMNRKQTDSTKIKEINTVITNAHLLNEKIADFSKNIYKEKPHSFLAAYLKMQEEPEYKEPKFTKNQPPQKDIFSKRYYYIKSHYFDNVAFNDTRLLRTRLIYEKLEYYFNVFITQNPDSLCDAAKTILQAAKINEETYRFILNFLNYNYRNPKDASQEMVFVYIAENYYLNNNAPWADSKYLKLLQQKVDAIIPTMVGEKAANLDLQTIDEIHYSIYNIKAKYLVILFWSPDCNMCTAEIPEYYKIYNNFKSDGIKFLAVYVHSDKTIWKNYLVANKLDWLNVYDPMLKSNFAKLYKVDVTPKIYVLDSDKKIVAKNLSPIQLERFFKSEFQ